MRKILALIILSTLLIPTLATAQDSWLMHIHESGKISVSYPPDWFAEDDVPSDGNDTNTVIRLANSEILLGFAMLSGDTLTSGEAAMSIALIEGDEFDDYITGLADMPSSVALGVIAGYFGVVSNLGALLSDDSKTAPISLVSYSDVELIGYDAGLLEIEANGNSVLMMIIQSEEHNTVFAMLATSLGESSEHEETFIQIIESVTFEETE